VAPFFADFERGSMDVAIASWCSFAARLATHVLLGLVTRPEVILLLARVNFASGPGLTLMLSFSGLSEITIISLRLPWEASAAVFTLAMFAFVPGKVLVGFG